MSALTSIERVQRFLKRLSHDRIPVYEHFWGETASLWQEQGKIKDKENIGHEFDFDLTLASAFNMMADIDFEPKVLEETKDTILTLDGNGAVLRRMKHHTGTPEHVGYRVVDRNGWNELKSFLTPDKKRIKFENYRLEKKWAKENDRFFFFRGINVFECMHPVCGHENLLVGMALDPEWISEMADTYATLIVSLMEELFEGEGKPDGVWFSEDLGYKEHSFISPAMYDELIKPSHMKTFDYAHSLGLPVVMHSCGYVEKLIPNFLEAGIDCLQALEVKAGMDPVRIHKQYGEHLSLMGGMDIRELYSNDLKRVDRELIGKLPSVMGHYGYALHSDHSVPYTVDYDTYVYFMNRGLELGTYGRRT